jgi:alkylated DNA nucleotide flippase Atl1
MLGRRHATWAGAAGRGWPTGVIGDTAAVLPTPFAERVLDTVASIPPGRVLTYGDVAERVGSRGARAVGAALSRFGGGVPWWRVVRADGGLAPGHEREAAELLVAEGALVLPGPAGPRVDLTIARWSG